MSILPSSGDRLCEGDFDILPATNDAHGGVIVDLKEPMDTDIFLTLLRTSLSKWKKQAKCGVWIKLPTALVNLVETAVKEGFRYHHAEPNYLMLVYWIIPETSCTIPPNASHRVRVGGLVLNDKKESRKKEVYSMKLACGRYLATGIVEAGEELLATAVREVKEETGVDTEFVELLAFRHAHNSLFGKSELFFLCMLRPLSTDIKKQDFEIDAAKWMPFEEYAAHPIKEMHEPFKYENELPISSYFKEQLSYLYLNSHDLDKSSNSVNDLGLRQKLNDIGFSPLRC